MLYACFYEVKKVGGGTFPMLPSQAEKSGGTRPQPIDGHNNNNHFFSADILEDRAQCCVELRNPTCCQRNCEKWGGGNSSAVLPR